MKSWYEGPLAAFDITTTGTDAERDRIISAALVVQDTTGFPPRVTRWLIDPGVPIPAEVAGAHGLTEEYLHHNGRWPAPVMEEVAKALAEQCAASRPLVVLNAPFRLTVLDRELRRHRSWCLARYLERVSLCVLDPRVLDRHLDHYRQGGRSFPELCAQYDVTAEGAPGPATDATAVMALARAVGRRFSTRMERLSPPELHALQAVWHAGQARGLPIWFARTGTEEAVHPAWPLRPELPAEAA